MNTRKKDKEIRKKWIHEKVNIRVNWFELSEMYWVYRKYINESIKFNQQLGTKFGYFSSDRYANEMYRKIIKLLKNYD